MIIKPLFSSLSLRVLSLAFFSWVCLGLHNSQGQAIGNIMPGYTHTFSVAGSYGGTFDGEGQLWGFSGDYTMRVSEKWVGSFSIAFDQETTDLKPTGNLVSNTISAQFAAGYLLNNRLSLGGGFAKGVLGGPRDQSLKWKDFGKDWTVGVLGVYTFWFKGPHSFDVSSSLEYRLNEGKWSYSIDVGYGFSF